MILKHNVHRQQPEKSEIFIFSGLCTSQYQNRSPPPPPGQSPGIWLALSSVQWGIWPKMRPARWGIWLSSQNVCQRSETKGFRNSLIQYVSGVHGSLLLSIPRRVFCCCRFMSDFLWMSRIRRHSQKIDFSSHQNIPLGELIQGKIV